MTRTALAWAEPLIHSDSPVVRDIDRLTKEMVLVFDHDVSGQEAAMRLTRLLQGNETVTAFSITFRTLAGETGWAEAPLQ